MGAIAQGLRRNTRASRRRLTTVDTTYNIMRTRVSDTRTTHPGSYSSCVLKVTGGSLSTRKWVPTGTYYPNNGTYSPAKTPQLATSGKTGKYSAIADVLGSPGTFNYCSHTVEEWNCPLEVLELVGECYPYNGGSTCTSVISLGAEPACSYAKDSYPTYGSDESMIDEALTQMHPRIVLPELNLFQEVGELREAAKSFASLFQLFETVLDNKRFQAGLYGAAMKGLRRKTFDAWSLRDWLHFASAIDLSWKLGVKPLLDTGRRFHAMYAKLDAHLKRFTDSESVLRGVSTRSVSASYTPTTTPYYKWGNTRERIVEVHTTAKVKYHSGDIDALRERLKRDLKGLYPAQIPSALWELTPMTFIADMFWNFGRTLRIAGASPIKEVGYTVLWTGWSKKITSTCSGWVNPCSGSYYTDTKRTSGAPLVTGSVINTSYLREPKALDLETFVPPIPQWRMPDGKRLITIAEVAMGLKNRHRKLVKRIGAANFR